MLHTSVPFSCGVALVLAVLCLTGALSWALGRLYRAERRATIAERRTSGLTQLVSLLRNAIREQRQPAKRGRGRFGSTLKAAPRLACDRREPFLLPDLGDGRVLISKSAAVAPAPAGAKRQLKSLDVSIISLVGSPANGEQLIYKDAAHNHLKTVTLAKYDAVEGIAYGIVYAPLVVDSHGDYATAETIKAAAHGFLTKGTTGAVDTEHNLQTDGGTIVESWIVKTGDELFPASVGAWAVAIKVADAYKAQVEKGEFTGFSLYGTAMVEDVAKSAERLPWYARIARGMAELIGVKKDFNDSLVNRTLWAHFDALGTEFDRALYPQYYYDAPVPEGAPAADAITYLLTQIDQFRAAVAAIPTGDASVVKTGDPAPQQTHGEAETLEVDVTKKELAAAVAEGLAPFASRLDAVEKANTAAVATVADLAKASSGSKQLEQPAETAQTAKSDAKPSFAWA